MAMGSECVGEMPVVKRLEDFDRRSGNLIERLVFNNRLAGVLVCLAVTAVLAMMSHNDTDVGVPQGTAKEGVIGGAAGFKLVGIVVGAAVQSRPLSRGMGIYGLGRSAYSNFLARGYDVQFPKGTALAVGLWLRRDCAEPAEPESGGVQ